MKYKLLLSSRQQIPPEFSLFYFSHFSYSFPSKIKTTKVKSWLIQAAFNKKSMDFFKAVILIWHAQTLDSYEWLQEHQRGHYGFFLHQ